MPRISNDRYYYYYYYIIRSYHTSYHCVPGQRFAAGRSTMCSDIQLSERVGDAVALFGEATTLRALLSGTFLPTLPELITPLKVHSSSCLRAAVHRRCQCPPKRLGSNKTVEASDTRTFITPRVNTKTFGERSFSYAGPSVWNNLPQTLCHSDSACSFKAALKTHLFSNYF